MNLFSHVLLVTLRAAVQKIRILQRADPHMTGIHRTVFRCLRGHMAVRTGQERRMYTALSHVCFKLRMLYLQLAHTGIGIDPVRKHIAFRIYKRILEFQGICR